MPSRFPRFSLRGLFVVVTAICIFLGYELNWIHQRRKFIADLNASQEDIWMRINDPGYDSPTIRWLFRKHPVNQIRLLVPYEESKRITQRGTDPKKAYEPYVTAKRLFPESEVKGYVIYEGKQYNLGVFD